MDFDSFYHKLHENVDVTNYVAKYTTFGKKLKEYYNFSSHEDTFLDLKVAPYFNSGILYKFYFKTINKTKTLKKIIKLVNNKIFEIKADTNYVSLEVVYMFKDIKKIIDKNTLNMPAQHIDLNM
jgi:hypothetical protein